MVTIKGMFIFSFTVGIAWVLLQKHKFKHEMELELLNIEPSKIWTLFSNHTTLMALNPTVISYKVLSEWKSGQRDTEGSNLITGFRIMYKEHLVYIPFVIHEATATYKSYSQGGGQPYQIVSEHLTEVLGTSLKTTEVMNFLQMDGKITSSRMTSIVEYECHLLLSKYCEMEFRGQRALINNKIQALAESIS